MSRPQIVAKRQRRFGGADNLVISLTAKGLTTGEVCAHLAEVDRTTVSEETISTITDRVTDSPGEWQNQPLLERGEQALHGEGNLYSSRGLFEAA